MIYLRTSRDCQCNAVHICSFVSRYGLHLLLSLRFTFPKVLLHFAPGISPTDGVEQKMIFTEYGNKCIHSSTAVFRRRSRVKHSDAWRNPVGFGAHKIWVY